jgi:predicted Zn-dependent protease
VALVMGTIAAGMAQALPAEACGDFYTEERPPPKPKPKPTAEESIAIAEPAMLKEQPGVAAGALSEGFPDLKKTGMDAPRQKLKALRTMAVALARVDGALSTPGPFYAATAAARAANLDWSIATLRKLNEARPNDPVLQAELGEALAHVPAQHEEALRVLSALADKDVMGSAHAYAQLARLRASKGDLAGSREAARRCQAMATSPALCPAAPADPPAKVVAQTGA